MAFFTCITMAYAYPLWKAPWTLLAKVPPFELPQIKLVPCHSTYKVIRK
jgi:hypothetical protein